MDKPKLEIPKTPRGWIYFLFIALAGSVLGNILSHYVHGIDPLGKLKQVIS